MLIVKQGGIKYHFFKVFGMTRPGIEPRSPRPLGNTLPTELISVYKLFVLGIFDTYVQKKKKNLKKQLHKNVNINLLWILFPNL